MYSCVKRDAGNPASSDFIGMLPDGIGTGETARGSSMYRDGKTSCLLVHWVIGSLGN
jgi:hypothetical protein